MRPPAGTLATLLILLALAPAAGAQDLGGALAEVEATLDPESAQFTRGSPQTFTLIVRNTAATPTPGEVRLHVDSLPSGWQHDLDLTPFTLAGGEEEVLEFQVTAQRGTAGGQHTLMVWATLTYALPDALGGFILDEDRDNATATLELPTSLADDLAGSTLPLLILVLALLVLVALAVVLAAALRSRPMGLEIPARRLTATAGQQQITQGIVTNPNRRPQEARPVHGPLPAGWSVRFHPDRLQVGGGAKGAFTVAVAVPADAQGATTVPVTLDRRRTPVVPVRVQVNAPSTDAQHAGTPESVPASADEESVAPADAAQGPYYDYKGESYPIRSVEGIGPEYAKRLHRMGIATTARLCYEDAADLAQRLDLPEGTVVSWKAMAELMKVKGIGPQYAEILARSGILGIEGLKDADPEEAAQRIREYLAGRETAVLGAPVTANRIAGWQAAAKGMRRVRQRPPEE